jgi:hypothetical protein
VVSLTSQAAWTLPDRIFGPVWMLLYTGTGIATWRFSRTGASAREPLVARLSVQLVLNVDWSAARCGSSAAEHVELLYRMCAPLHPQLCEGSTGMQHPNMGSHCDQGLHSPGGRTAAACHQHRGHDKSTGWGKLDDKRICHVCAAVERSASRSDCERAFRRRWLHGDGSIK